MTFYDRPLPEGLELPKLQHKGTQNLTNHEGRIPGVLNRITRDLKEGIIEGAAVYCYDGKGEGGLHGYLAMCAAKFPKAYLGLLAKLLPLQVSGQGPIRPTIAVNVVSIESGSFLSAEDCERLRAPAQIEQAPSMQPEPEAPDV